MTFTDGINNKADDIKLKANTAITKRNINAK
jgi:hypothetical protein